jgi:hypothetical protein
MSKKTKLSEKNIKEITVMLKDKQTLMNIAKYYGVSMETVRRFCINNNISYNKKPTTNTESYYGKKVKKRLDRKELLEVYNNTELNLKEKCKALNCDHNTLYRDLAFYNIDTISNRDAFYYVDINDKEDLFKLLTNKDILTSTKCSKLSVSLERLAEIYKENELNYFDYNNPAISEDKDETSIDTENDEENKQTSTPLKLLDVKHSTDKYKEYIDRLKIEQADNDSAYIFIDKDYIIDEENIIHEEITNDEDENIIHEEITNDENNENENIIHKKITNDEDENTEKIINLNINSQEKEINTKNNEVKFNHNNYNNKKPKQIFNINLTLNFHKDFNLNLSNDIKKLFNVIEELL